MTRRLVVVLGIAALALGAVVLRDSADRGHPNDGVRIVLPNAKGFRIGAPVTYGGQDFGRVEHITIAKGHAGVGIRVSNTTRRLRRADSVRVVSLGILGDKTVDIKPGPTTAATLGPADTLVAAGLSPS